MTTASTLEHTSTDSDESEAGLQRRITLLTITGTVLVGSALALHTLVAPQLIRVPQEFRDSVQMSGTYSGVNMVALNTGRINKLLATDAPFEATQSISTVRAEGNTTVVDVSIRPVVDGWIQSATTHRYAVDRDTFGSATTKDDDVVASKGFIFTLPPNPEPKDGYPLWNQAIEEAVPSEYLGTRTVGDRLGYVYKATSSGAVVDPTRLGLPKSIAKDELIGLAPEFIKVMEPEQVQRLLPAFASMPDDVPLSYTATGFTEMTADAQVGSPLTMTLDHMITASIDVGDEEISAAFSHYVAASTPASRSHTAEVAGNYGRLMSLVQWYIPLGLATLGSIAICAAAAMVIRRANRRSKEQTE